MEMPLRRLEDVFFLQRDQELIRQRRELAQLKETTEAISRASGITDELVLGKLVELNVRPETVAALSLVPLIEVAWADGELHDREKEAILRAARTSGISPGSMEHGLLSSWLKHRPPEELLTAWIHYVKGLRARMSPVELAHLRKALLDHADDVARAAGGFLGLTNPVSDAEKKILNLMDAAFDQAPSA
jgi:hypothetical protein